MPPLFYIEKCTNGQRMLAKAMHDEFEVGLLHVQAVLLLLWRSLGWSLAASGWQTSPRTCNTRWCPPLHPRDPQQPPRVCHRRLRRQNSWIFCATLGWFGQRQTILFGLWDGAPNAHIPAHHTQEEVFLDSWYGGVCTAQCHKRLSGFWGGAPNTHTIVPHRPGKVVMDTWDGGV